MCLEKFCKRCCEMHKSQVNCILHLIAAIVVIYALWINSVKWILIGILIAVIGHIIQEVSGKKQNTAKKRKR